jgi:chemotaxis protein methyltransferase CheR
MAPLARTPDGRAEPPRAREFGFEYSDFVALRDLVKETIGIHLADSKQELVYGRVSRRLRHLGLKSFTDYRRHLQADADELIEFCNAMTTNLTSFFREAHHFDYLKEQLLVSRRDDARASRRIRLWSAACSSGEEPYSIAMSVCEAIPDWQRWDIKILATDIDSQMVMTAQRGVYGADRVKALGAERLKRFFREHQEGSEQRYQVIPELAQLITFKQLNLLHPLPMKGPLEAIFCRNVIIYFDKATQRELFARIASLQRCGDLLFLGHSESLFKVCDAYELMGRTIYRRSEGTEGRRRHENLDRG